MSKRIILLLDGTWNDADAKGVADTNIVRLREIVAASLDPTPSSEVSEALTPAAGVRQFSITARNYSHEGTAPKPHLVYYERGVGTGGFLNAMAGGAFAVGLARNIRRAYIFLSRNYEDGDEIFIFGFSRGSYTARSLAGYINAIGLLTGEFCDAANESKAWYYYRTNPADRLPTVSAELARFVHSRSNLSIKCLGVFDTVGALGIPLPLFWRENRDLFEFHDVGLSRISEVNLHALAIDEHRESFEPTLWREQKFGGVAIPTEQVWFPGAHADVGGGYVDEENRQKFHQPALDDVSLDWMLKRVLHYYPDFPAKRGANWPKVSQGSARAQQHEARANFYRLRPFAFRAIGNSVALTKPGFFERDICRDRHANPIGEMIHISALDRLGHPIAGYGKIYQPRNLMAALEAIEECRASGDQRLKIVDWSGSILDASQALAGIEAAKRRLNASLKKSWQRAV